MSEQELQQGNVSEETGSEDRQVPVAEAIRYRKRAQQAEKELSEMKAERDVLKSETQTLSAQLGEIQQDQQIRQLLTAAETTDMETASLLVKDRMTSSGDADAEAVIEQLRAEKEYLFTSRTSPGRSVRTAGVRQRPDGSAALQDAAQKAARSGSCVDVQEYLRVRRQYI